MKLIHRLSFLILKPNIEKANPFVSLPPEILSEIFSYINSFIQLGILRQVCKQFFERINEDIIFGRNYVSISGKNRNYQLISIEKSKDWKWLSSCLARKNAVYGFL